MFVHVGKYYRTGPAIIYKVYLLRRACGPRIFIPTIKMWSYSKWRLRPPLQGKLNCREKTDCELQANGGLLRGKIPWQLSCKDTTKRTPCTKPSRFAQRDCSKNFTNTRTTAQADTITRQGRTNSQCRRAFPVQMLHKTACEMALNELFTA